MGPLRSVLLACGLAGPAAACDLALVFAVDVSGSVDPAEYQIQMEGLSDALQDPLIADALVGLKAQVMLLQWTGASRQSVSISWTPLDDLAAVEGFAARVAKTPRVWRNFSTAIGEAIAVGIDAFEDVPHCRERTIDLSGDGPWNEGVEPRALRQQLQAKGITVNGLAIEESSEGLSLYYQREVIFGPSAFVETASTFHDYPQAIRRKLMREVVEVYGAVITQE